VIKGEPCRTVKKHLSTPTKVEGCRTGQRCRTGVLRVQEALTDPGRTWNVRCDPARGPACRLCRSTPARGRPVTLSLIPGQQSTAALCAVTRAAAMSGGREQRRAQRHRWHLICRCAPTRVALPVLRAARVPGGARAPERRGRGGKWAGEREDKHRVAVERAGSCPHLPRGFGLEDPAQARIFAAARYSCVCFSAEDTA
jgi:hypothetical protein